MYLYWLNTLAECSQDPSNQPAHLIAIGPCQGPLFMDRLVQSVAFLCLQDNLLPPVRSQPPTTIEDIYDFS